MVYLFHIKFIIYRRYIRKEGDFDYDFMITRATYCDLAYFIKA